MSRIGRLGGVFFTLNHVVALNHMVGLENHMVYHIW